MTNRELIDKHLSGDRKLKPIIDKLEPLALNPSDNVYHELVRNIAYQQISYKAADTIFARFIDLMGRDDYSPSDLLSISIESLRSVGFSRQKAEYIVCISRHFEQEGLMSCDWESLDDEEIIRQLTAIKGVGIWTAKMILIFQLARPDVFPHEDLAIQQLIRELYNVEAVKKEFILEANKIAERWRPYRTIASLYLWSYKRAQLATGH